MARLMTFGARRAFATAAVIVWAIPAAALEVSPPGQAGQVGQAWLVDFESGLPAGAKAKCGSISLVADGSAAVGNRCLRYRRSAGAGGASYLLLPLPRAGGISPDGKLSAWIKTQRSSRPVRLRWHALGRDNGILFQRRFEIDNNAEWTRIEWDIFRWRWGDGRVGDWSQVQAIALRVESDVDSLWLDDVRFRKSRPLRPDAGERLPRRWLRKIAFGDCKLRAVAGDEFVVCTDAVEDLSRADLKRVIERAGRARKWLGRVFGGQVKSTRRRHAPKLLIFRRDRDYRAFFRRLGSQWNCSIVPPTGGGYTVQDISAAPYDSRWGPDSPVLLHEAVHSLVARELHLPTGTVEHSWLQEGLANYLQLCVHPQSMDWQGYARNFRGRIGRGTFFRPLSEIFSRRVTRRHYSQVASVVAFLVAEHPQWLRELARGLAKDRPLGDILADLGADLRRLEELWFAWGKKTLATVAGVLVGPRTHFPLPPEWIEPAGRRQTPTTNPAGRAKDAQVL